MQRVLITGPPLNGRDEYLEKVRNEFKGNVKLLVYNVFEFMKKVGRKYGCPGITRENVLDIPKGILAKIRLEAFRTINEEIEENNEDNTIHIISTPNIFLVSPHGSLTTNIIEGFDQEIFCNYIRPDYIVITIDDALEVLKRLKNDPRWRSRVKASLREIVEWRGMSIRHIDKMVQDVYRLRGKQLSYIVFSIKHEPGVLIDLINDLKPRVYLSYNMTGLPPESFNKIKRFYKKLRKYFIVFDPGTISEWKLVNEYDEALEKGDQYISADGEKELLSISEVEDAIDIMRTQIVSRDYNLVEESHAICVYHHSKYPSYGVMAEVIHGSEQAKPVYVLYPFNKRLSPFFEHYVKGSSIHVDRIISLRGMKESVDISELEERIINKMLDDVCSRLWPSYDPMNREKYCREFYS